MHTVCNMNLPADIIYKMKIPRFLTASWFIGICITIIFLVLFLAERSPFTALENGFYDYLSRSGSKKSDSSIVIFAIDDQSIKDLGPWPWPRKHFSDAIALLSRTGAKIIGSTVHFPQKDPNPGLAEIRTIRKTLGDNHKLMKYRTIKNIYRSLKEGERKADHDAKLVASVRSSGKVVLPALMVIGQGGSKENASLPKYLQRNSTRLSYQRTKGEVKPFILNNPLAAQGNKDVQASAIIPPFDALADQALAIGFTNFFPDNDGTVRNTSLLVSYANRFFPSFALQVALKFKGLDEKQLDFVKEKQGFIGLKGQSLMIPTDSRYSMLISYKPGKSPFPIYSFSDILNNKLDKTLVKGKIILIGPTTQNLANRHRTTLSRDLSDVEISAHVVHTVLSGNYFVRPSWAFILESFVILYFGIFLSLVVPKMKKKMSSILIGVFLLTWIIVTLSFFLGFGLWIKAVSSVLFCILGYSAVILIQFVVAHSHGIASDSIESYKMLGLTLQSQGMLDMAFEKFMKCPVNNESVKSLLYNLGLDFERKRMLNKAVSVYEHILKGGTYRDIETRIKRLKAVSETVVPGTELYSEDRTMYLEDTITRPTLGRYEVVEELGRGAMGTVYLGRDPKINRDVAIKTLKYGDMIEEDLREFKEQFFREAEAAGTLSHPNIMTIYDIGEEHDMAYIAMELLKGKDLTEYTQKGNLLSPGKVLRIISAVAEALDYAHENGVVHRDIKPGNIMLLEDGSVKVADFGIAMMLVSAELSKETETVIGTPNYMSPEQISGKKVDGRSDFFSLGCVMYELLSGEKPFKGESMEALVKSITQGKYTPLTESVPLLAPCYSEIIDKLLARAISRRYQKGADIVKDINDCMKDVD